MKNFRPFFPKEKDKQSQPTRLYLIQNLLSQSSYISNPPNIKQKQDMSEIVKSNRFQNLLIKLTYRRMNWVFQNIKLVDFDKSSILDITQYNKQKSRSEIFSMTAHNLVLVIDKVLLIKIQNKLSDAFLRIRLIKKKRTKKPIKAQHKIGIFLLSKLFQKRQKNFISKLLTFFPQSNTNNSNKKVRFQSMQNIEQSISKYKSQINRLQNVHYKSTSLSYSAPNNIYIPKQSFKTPRKSTAGVLISEFQSCLTDVSNTSNNCNFKKNKQYNY